MSLSANQIKGIIAVIFNGPYFAKILKSHNNPDIIYSGSRIVVI